MAKKKAADIEDFFTRSQPAERSRIVANVPVESFKHFEELKELTGAKSTVEMVVALVEQEYARWGDQ
jgi:hypothetical protein